MRFSYCNCFIDDVNVIPNSYIIWNDKCGILIRNIMNEIKFEYFKCKPSKPKVLSITQPSLSFSDSEKKARNRSRYASTNLDKDYYTTNNRYLYSRCKLYYQNNFNFLFTGNNSVKPGDPNSLNNEYTGSCKPNTIVSADIINAYKCSSVQYKPNNYKYSTQGAVTSSGRLLNLIVSTINKNTNDIKLNPQLKSKHFPSSMSSQNAYCCPTAKPAEPVVFVYVVNNLYTVNQLNIERYIPILTNSNFKYTYTYKYTSGTITLKITYNDYNSDVNKSLTGLSFKNINKTDFNNKFKAFIISNFSGIPLNTQGSQFSGITTMLIFTDIDSPVILPNTNVSYCFYGCSNFNSSLSNWNSINFTDTSYMFDSAIKFNNGQPNNSVALMPLNWSLNNITTMEFMFNNAIAFNQTFCNDITSGNIYSVTSMESMFSGALMFNNGGTSGDITHPLWPFVLSKPNLDIITTNFSLNSGLSSGNTPGWVLYPYYGVSTFVYTWKSVVPSNIVDYIPIVTNSYFTYSYTYVTSLLTTTVTVYYKGIASQNDPNYNLAGLTCNFGSIVSNINADCSLFTIKFSGIPLHREGSQFAGITNLVFINDIYDQPILTPFTSLRSCFDGCINFNNYINWKTSYLNNLTDMYVSTVTDMSYMFRNCYKFNNGDTGNAGLLPITFTTDAVTNMTSMFNGASKFNQKLDTTTFITTSVTDLSSMFYGATIFNNGSTTNDISNPLAFDTSATTDMSYMFYNAIAFNQTFCNTIASTDLQNVLTMNNMFFNATIFNNGGTSGDNTHPLWPLVTSIPNASLTFSGFSTSSRLSLGNTPGWMYPYYGTSTFIYSWRSTSFTITTAYIPIATDTTNFNYNFTQSYNSVANATTVTVYYKGKYTTALAGTNYNLVGLTCNLTGLISFIKTNCSTFTVSQFGGIILHPGGSQFSRQGEIFDGGGTPGIRLVLTNATGDIQPYIMPNTSLASCFNACTLFNSPVNFTTTNVTNMNSMFANCRGGFNPELSFDTTFVTDMTQMFQNCSYFTNANKELNFNLSSIITMQDMFQGCAFNNVFSSTTTQSTLSNVTNMNGAFSNYNATSSFTNNNQLLFPNVLIKPAKLSVLATGIAPGLTLKNTPNWFLPYYGTTIFVYTWRTTNQPITTDYIPIATDTTNFNYDFTQSYNSVANATTVTVYYKGKYTTALAGTNYNLVGLTSNLTGLVSFINTNCSTFTVSQFGGIILYPGGSQFSGISSTLIFTNATGDIQPYIMPNTSLASCFTSCSGFNSPVNFTTTNVTNMNSMFINCSIFNQKISFNTTNVTDMKNMFYSCAVFNNSDSDNNGSYKLSFTTNSLIDMSNMFQNCSRFNQQITFTDTSAVKTMESTFIRATIFNNGVTSNVGGQPLSFTTNNVTSMINMFKEARGFNQQINFTDTSAVTTMEGMFTTCSVFNNGVTNNIGGQPLSFTTNNVITMVYMFQNCSKFNQQLNFNPNSISTYLNKVSNMNSMFKSATIFNNGQVSGDTTHVLFSDYYINRPTALTGDPSGFCQSSYLLTGNAPSWGKV